MLLNETDLKKAVPISENFLFKRVTPDIRRAELKYIKPILGATLLADLNTKYDAETLSEEEQGLLDFIQPALGHLAMWLYVPKGNVYVGDNGIQSVHGGDNKPAFEWQKEDFEKSMQSNGFDALDELIEYLESVAADDFPAWLDSEGCTLVRENFVNTARVFTLSVPKLKGSRFLFSYLKPIVSRIEKPLIQSVVGTDLYAELKTQIKGDSLTDDNLSLMEMIVPAVCHSTWANALYELGIQVDAEGVHLLNNAFSGTIKGKQAAEADRIRVVQDHHNQVSADFVKQLQDYLVENVDSYPLFKNGETYNEDDADPQFENKDNGIYGIL